MVRLDHPMPFQELTSRQFESFSANLMMALDHSTQVHLVGHEGQKQGGIDLEVIFPDGVIWGGQAKRRTSFGPADLRGAVNDLSVATSRNILFLSSGASPMLREAAHQYPDWELWDAYDLSERVRTLPKVEQFRLVDIFWPGRRLEILGEREPSPWMTPAQAFAGLDEWRGDFSHAWDLVGRTRELDQMQTWIREPRQPLLFLHGPGGAGKSRLLKAFTDQLGKDDPGLQVYYLSPEALQAWHFEAVGHGRQLWVCDDAHQRADLGHLLQEVRVRRDEVKLLVSLRSYGMDRLRQLISVFYLSQVPQIQLTPLELIETEALAKAALEHFGGDLRMAQGLAKYSEDCPLATVLGAKIISEQGQGMHPAFLVADTDFHTELLPRILASQVQAISQGHQGQVIGETLSLLALVQPFFPEEESLWRLIGKTTGLRSHQVPAILKRLEESGLLSRRGRRCRIVPDLLADFLMEGACITDGASTGYAETVMEDGGSAFLEPLLFNLGQLDWRLRKGRPRPYQLLKGLWARLVWSDTYPNADVEAAAKVAYYQPELALEFVDRLMADGHGGEAVVAILEPIAFHELHLQEVCERLWALCQAGLSHGKASWEPALKVLGSLATPKKDMPVGLMDRVVDFGLSLLEQKELLNGPISPLDFLCHALAVEGSSETSSVLAITFHPFWVIPEVVAPIRRKVIDRLLSLLASQDPRVGCEVAGRFRSALQRPIGLFNSAIPEEVQNAWRLEFRRTLEELTRVLDQNPVSPIVLYSIATAVIWLAEHEAEEIADLAKNIVERLRCDWRGRVISALINPYQHVLRPSQSPSMDGLKETARALLQLLPDPGEQFDFLASCLEEIRNSPHQARGGSDLLWALFEASPSLALAYLRAFPTSLPTQLRPFAHAALANLLQTDSIEALEAVQIGLAGGEGPFGLSILGLAFTFGPFGPVAEGFRGPVLRAIVIAETDEVFRFGHLVAHRMAQNDPGMARNILSEARIGAHPDWVADYLMGLCGTLIGPVAKLSTDQIQRILDGLLPLKQLEDYWVQDFLRQSLQQDPAVTLAFIRKRIEGSTDQGWDYRPLPYGPFLETTLSLLDQPDGLALLEEFFEWSQTLRGHEKFRAHLPHVIQAFCAAGEGAVVDALDKLVERGSAEALDLASMVLGSAENGLVFGHKDLVARLVSTARQHGKELHDTIFHALVQSAVSGVRQGTPGCPTTITGVHRCQLHQGV